MLIGLYEIAVLIGLTFSKHISWENGDSPRLQA